MSKTSSAGLGVDREELSVADRTVWLVAEQRLYTFAARLRLHQGQGAWHFLTVPPEISSDIAERTTAIRRHFGPVQVTATVGDSAWHTSLFPDTQTRAYLLPVKMNRPGSRRGS
jgi:Domain of unknown function (DUF1905)